MIYQLPTGKIVHLSLEEYLNLTDEDVQYLISTGLGSAPNNPFYGSAMSKPTRDNTSVDVETHDKSMDYHEDSDQLDVDMPINLDELPDQEI